MVSTHLSQVNPELLALTSALSVMTTTILCVWALHASAAPHKETVSIVALSGYLVSSVMPFMDTEFVKFGISYHITNCYKTVLTVNDIIA